METGETMVLPEFFRPILWSYNFDKLDPKKNASTIILQAINYGTLAHWKWIRHFYGEEKIREIVSKMPATAIRPQALRLATLLFNVTTSTHASRGSHR
jgi:hypothetical protein